MKTTKFSLVLTESKTEQTSNVLTSANIDTKNTETTVASPETGDFTGSNGNAMQNTAIVTVAALLVFTLAVIIICKIKKHHKLSFVAALAIIAALSVGSFNLNSSFAIEDETEDTNNLAIDAPAEITLTGENNKSALITGKATVAVTDNTLYGYNLYAATNGNLSFTPIAGRDTKAIVSITEPGTLTTNTYGYTLEKDAKAEDAVWRPLSDLVETIASVETATEANSATEIYFGILTDDTIPAGTYELGLDFYATAIRPTSISQISYMQEFKNLTEDEVTTIKASMEVGEQYRLKDNRDEKGYYISKLHDDNIWMTQNLDHDVVTTEDFYTPENTDITENWTSPNATLKTDDAASWNSATDDVNLPQSYDPGDLCWTGNFSSTTGGAKEHPEEFYRACQQDDASHYHIGNYYGWATSIASNDSSALATRYEDANRSICPAGWKLPNVEILDHFSLDENGEAIVDRSELPVAPYYFTYGGRFVRGALVRFAYSGEFTTSSVISYLTSIEFSMTSTGFGRSTQIRNYGLPIRCLVR